MITNSRLGSRGTRSRPCCPHTEEQPSRERTHRYPADSMKMPSIWSRSRRKVMVRVTWPAGDRAAKPDWKRCQFASYSSYASGGMPSSGGERRWDTVPHREQGHRPERGDPGVAEFGVAVLQRHRLGNEPLDGAVGAMSAWYVVVTSGGRSGGTNSGI